MNDRIYWARVDDPTQAVLSLIWPDPSYMYLERVPAAWLSEAEIANGLRLEHLDTTISFQEWERGRVFCSDFEVRWEEMDGAFQMIYVGPEPAPPGFAQAEELNLSNAEIHEQSYYLWGKRVPDNEFDTVGINVRLGFEPFFEFQVPRVLYYPVSDEARRVKLHVVEYHDPHQGELLYYRFRGLEEA